MTTERWDALVDQYRELEALYAETGDQEVYEELQAVELLLEMAADEKPTFAE